MLQGKYDEAEPLYRESLAIDKKIYGDEHPSVATDLTNLAGLLKSQVSESFSLSQHPVFENADHF